MLRPLPVCLVALIVSRGFSATNPIAFTAEYVVTTHNAANVELQNAITVYAQRGDGSNVLLQKTAGPGIPSGLRTVLDIPGKRMVTVDPATKSLTTFVRTDSDLEPYRRPSATCREHKNFALDPTPQAKIFGFAVMRFSGTVPASRHTAERWLAPELNCFALREEVTLMPEQFKHRRTTISIRLGEPDPAPFEIPVAGYVERNHPK
jgi:hypothetical protein